MARYNNRYAFFEGEIVPIEDAKISIMTHGFNYGTAAFGGLRGYWNEEAEELYVFRPHEHFERLLNSAKMLMIDLPYTRDELVNILHSLLQKEGYRQDCYIRPLVYKSDEVVGVRLNGLTGDFALFAVPFGQYIDNEEGTRVGTSSWRRLPDDVLPPRGKFTGAYVSSAFMKTEALLNGYDEALVLDYSGHVSEGSAENIFIVRNGKLITPPVSSDILEGITRRSLIQLAREELSLEVVERVIDRSEIYIADEAFFCGTGVRIAMIVELDHRPIGNGKPGPVSKAVRDLYYDILHGRNEKYMHWLMAVYASKPVAIPSIG